MHINQPHFLSYATELVFYDLKDKNTQQPNTKVISINWYYFWPHLSTFKTKMWLLYTYGADIFDIGSQKPANQQIAAIVLSLLYQ